MSHAKSLIALVITASVLSGCATSRSGSGDVTCMEYKTHNTVLNGSAQSYSKCAAWSVGKYRDGVPRLRPFSAGSVGTGS